MRPESGRHAVVIGGGIGGLATAVGLSRIGWRVTVLERTPRLREAGAGISLLTNAQRALDQLGVGAAVRRRSAVMLPGGEGLRSPSGRRLMKPADPALLREYGLTTIVLPRPDLQGVLRDALPDGALRTGAEAVAIDDLPDGVAVTYRSERGEETVQGDVVIAADGAHSRTRAARWPLARPPAYSGHSVWRGLAENVDGDAEPGGNTWGLGLEFGWMPLLGRRVYWFAVANTPAGARYRDNHAEVWDRFGSWHDPIPALIKATPPGSVLHHDVVELAEPLPSYVSGRVALLGDAAHVMTSDMGQGACQALEDAVVLCAALSSAADVPAALADYDEQRRPRSQAIAAASRQMGLVKLQERRIDVRLRNLKMKFTRSRSGPRSIALVGDWQPPALPAGEFG